MLLARSQQELSSSQITPDETLWLRTLERYGQNCRHWAIARSAHDLPECPVFRPTAAEFAEPGRYIQSIMPQVGSGGVPLHLPARSSACMHARTSHESCSVHA
jgi:hypothetical protein